MIKRTLRGDTIAIAAFSIINFGFVNNRLHVCRGLPLIGYVQAVSDSIFNWQLIRHIYGPTTCTE